MRDMHDGTSARSRAVLVVMAVVVAAAIAGAAALSATRSTPDLDASTPEGVAQAYYEALVDGREADAIDLLTPQLRRRCDERDFRFYPADETVRVVLISTRVVNRRAEVEVEIDRIDDVTPFDLDGYSTRERLTMTRSGGRWLISELPRPIVCAEGS